MKKNCQEIQNAGKRLFETYLVKILRLFIEIYKRTAFSMYQLLCVWFYKVETSKKC